LAQCRGLYHDG